MYCIYRIKNKINGKTYIGQHKYKDLHDNYMGSGKLLFKAKLKYGIENFEKEILYSNIQYKETADDMERYAIAKERKLGKAEYNITDGGNGGNLGEEVNKKRRGKFAWNKGKHLTEEHRRKISKTQKGREGYWKGKHRSEEWKSKMSEAHKGKAPWNKGKKMSEEFRRKVSEAQKGKPGTFKGKHHSEETKRKMSENRKGRKRESFSEEWRRKLSEAKKGMHWKLVDGKRIWY